MTKTLVTTKAPAVSKAAANVQRKTATPPSSQASESATSVQTKIKVGTKGDKYEREADSVAEQVVNKSTEAKPEMQGIFPGIPVVERVNKSEAPAQEEDQKEQEKGDQEVQAKEQMSGNSEDESAQANQEDHVQSSEEVQEKEENEEVQAQEEDSVQEQEEHTQEQSGEEVQESEEVQEKQKDKRKQKLKKKHPKRSKSLSPELEAMLRGSLHEGEPMKDDIKGEMESGFGMDFSTVRIHTDRRSWQMNKLLLAQAFAFRNHIFFGQGKYNPDTREGKLLLAHELTHVVQQGFGIAKDEHMQQADEEVQEEEDDKESDNSEQDSEEPSEEKDGADEGETSEGENSEGEAENKADETSPQDDAALPTEKVDIPDDETPDAPESEVKDTSPPEQIKGLDESGGGEGVKSEPPPPPKAMELSGSTDKAMETFASASPTQIASTYPSLDKTISEKLKTEQKQTNDATPVLTAKLDGVASPQIIATPELKVVSNANIKEGATGRNAIAQVNKDAPANNKSAPVAQPKIPDTGSDEGGFFSWVRNNWGKLLSQVNTKGDDINTSAGPRIVSDVSGDANPERLGKQQESAGNLITEQQGNMSEYLTNHPGQKNIQAQKVDDPNKVQVKQEVSVQLKTEEQDNMAHFAKRPMEDSIRKKADEKLGAVLEKSMGEQKKKVQEEAKEKESEKDKTIKEAEAKTRDSNEKSGGEQSAWMKKMKASIAEEQNKGLKETNEKVANQQSELSQKKKETGEKVAAQIKDDNKKTSDKLDNAEKNAEKEKQAGEKEAAQEKQKLDSDSKKETWLEKTGKFVKDAFSKLTSAINFIFQKVRDGIKLLIDTARKAALEIIEAGRKIITGAIDAFGTVAKGLVNTFVGTFSPELAKKVNEKIDTGIQKTKEYTNKGADLLKKGVNEIADGLSKALDKILEKFQKAITAAVQIYGAILRGDFKEAAKIAFFAACDIAGIDSAMIIKFFDKVGDDLEIIYKDPAKFFMNVANGVKGGFKLFWNNIKQHLIKGLIAWLTGTMSKEKLTLPQSFDAKGVFHLSAQILAITYTDLREKLVKKLGKNGEKTVSRMEKVAGIVYDLVTKGPIVLWEKIKSSLSNIKEIVMNGIRDFIIITVIKEGIIWLISLLNPASALAKVAKLLFDFAVFLFENYERIIDFVKTVFETLGKLARGSVNAVSVLIEKILAKILPLLIGVLAVVANLGALGAKVRGIIAKIKDRIDPAINKVLDWIAGKIKKVQKAIAKVKAKVKKKAKQIKKKVLDWWKNLKKKFTNKDGESHTLFFKKVGKKLNLYIASDPKPVTNYLEECRKNAENIFDPKEKKVQLDLIKKAKAVFKNSNTFSFEVKGKSGSKDKKALEKKLAKISAAFIMLGGFNNDINTEELFPKKPDFKPGPESNSIKKERVGVNLLHKEQFNTGEAKGEPSGNFDSAKDDKTLGWKKIREMGLTATSSKNRNGKDRWVRLHRVPERLGGVAKPFNFMAGPSFINKVAEQFEHRAEKLLKEETTLKINNKKIKITVPIWYQTVVKYNNKYTVADSISIEAGIYAYMLNNEKKHSWKKIPNPKFKFNAEIYPNPFDGKSKNKIYVNYIGATIFGNYLGLSKTDIEKIPDEFRSTRFHDFEGLKNVFIESKGKKIRGIENKLRNIQRRIKYNSPNEN